MSTPILNESSCKLIISTLVEQKISICCRTLPNNEWSGTLFYKVVSGTYDNNLVLEAQDFYLRDVGSATSTEFDDDADAFNYQIENNLEDSIQGLIHSHNTMSTFFSGTDDNTLKSMGKQMPHFLSLIVNNAGKYCAKITRRRALQTCYTSFYGKEETCNDTIYIVEDKNVEVVFESAYNEINNYIKDRISTLTAPSKPATKVNLSTTKSYPTLWNGDEYDDVYYNHYPKNTIQAPKVAVPTLSNPKKSTNNQNAVTSKAPKEKKYREYLSKKIISLLYGSFLFVISDKIDIKKWCKDKMEKAFENNFIDEASANEVLYNCLNNIVGQTLVKYPDLDNEEGLINIECTILDILRDLPSNKYIEYLKDNLSDILYEYSY